MNFHNVKKISFIDLDTTENYINEEPLTPVVIAIQDSEDEDFEECGLVSARNIITTPFNFDAYKRKERTLNSPDKENDVLSSKNTM